MTTRRARHIITAVLIVAPFVIAGGLVYRALQWLGIL